MKKNIKIFWSMAAVLVIAALPRFASAHAFLEHADPKVGSTISVSPSRVTLHFTQSVEPAFSTVTVSDSDGKQVDKKDGTVDPNDQSTLIVSVPTLPAGIYTVEWKVTSVDTHKTHGSFTFTIAPKG